MRNAAFAVAALLFLAPLAGRAEPAEWHLDPNHTTLAFSVRHLGLSKVRGEVRQFDAAIRADSKTGLLTSVQATAKTGSVDTGNAKRDAHLRGDDFFAAKRFPEMKLATRAIKWEGNRFVAEADLTIRDVTRAVTFTGELSGPLAVDFGDGKQLRAGYQARTTINRRDFGLTFSGLAEGVAVVGDEVELTLDVQASRRLAE